MQKRNTATAGRGSFLRFALRGAAVLLTGALVLCVLLGSFVPLLPWLWVFVPTLALLCLGFVEAAIFLEIRPWAGIVAGIVAVALMGTGGALLRHQSSVKWTELAARDTLSIDRRVKVSLLEPIGVSSNVKYVRFSPALYDSVEPRCGDDHCMSFGRLGRAYSWTEEAITEAVAAARLSMAGADSVPHIKLDVEQSSQDGVVTIRAALRDSQGEFATMQIFRPDTDRDWSPTLPAFLHLVIEHNALSAMLYPRRPEAGKTPLRDFLQQAVHIVAASPGPEKRVKPQIVRSVSIEPRRLSRDSQEAREALATRSIDPACSDQVTLVLPPRGTSLGYVALARSSARIPYPMSAQVICRGEHVYVLTYGGAWAVHTFQRYTLDGTALGTYRVGTSAERQPRVSADFWRLDVGSIEEDEKHLSYDMEGWNREWVSRTPGSRHEDIILHHRQTWQISL